MAHASWDEVVAVQRDAATRDVLQFSNSAEKAIYLHIALEHKRSAIIRAGIITPPAFQRALDAYHAGRMLGVAGRPAFLHPQTEERLSMEIRRAQDRGQAFSKSDVAEWVFFILFFFVN
jgi:hypothetical protein